MHLQASLALSLRFVALTFASGAFVAACGTRSNVTTGDGGSEGGSAASSAELTACRALETASSNKSRRCGSAKLFPFDDVHAAHLASACATSLGARGVRVDAAKVATCAAALDAAPCDSSIPPECELPRGALVDGTPCATSTQCTSGRCVRPAGQSCGHCGPLASPGDACDPWMVGLAGGCGSGRCAWFVEMSEMTLTARCVDPPPPGAPCGDTQGGCATGDYCALIGNGATGNCAHGLAAGAACEPPRGGKNERPCAAGTTCVDSVCRGRGALGEACTGYAGPTFLADSCDDSTACDDATKVCAKVTLGKPGDACDDQARRCEHGFCEQGSGGATCVAFKSVGAACDASDVRDRCEGMAGCRSGTCQLDDPATCK